MKKVENKMPYETPELEIIYFETQDIITASEPDAGDLGDWRPLGGSGGGSWG